MYEEELHFGKLLLKQSDMVLTHLTPVTLTFDPVTPIFKGFLCCPGRMCGQTLRKVGQGVLKLLIRNEKVTDGHTCTKQYALSSSKGGILKDLQRNSLNLNNYTIS